ncbi:MAG: GGDEF domain-containing protein [Thermoleophilaceae bacterium]
MDPLFDLAGTERFEMLLAREELRRARTSETMTVAVVDLDGLRAANARHGAGAGTEMLRHCAGALQRNLRAVDELARTGPDEFSLLLHATDARRAGVWAERFEDDLEASAAGHPAAPLTCSIGIADTTEAATLIGVAARARRRMVFVQAMRRLRRARETGA